MAALPFFAIGPTAILSIVGLMHRSSRKVPTKKVPPKVIVDVIIPAYNAISEINLCLASLLNQTLKPRKIIVYDDASRDEIKPYAEDFARRIGLENVTVIRREKHGGKTPSLRAGAENSDSDVEFILDSDTVLHSDNYIERTVEELYKSPGVASACGTVVPIKEKNRMNVLRRRDVSIALKAHTDKYGYANYDLGNNGNILMRFMRFLSNGYRDTLYKFLQRFVYRAQMRFTGSIINPVGCAVAYRRKYLKEVFTEATAASLKDNLTDSEDVYIGFAFVNKGYRNVQVPDVLSYTLEPPIYRLPKQIFVWSSAFFQSNYYFKGIVLTPFKALKRLLPWNWSYTEKRNRIMKRECEEYIYDRQPLGKEWTKQHGRPIGWFIFTQLLEKITFPTVLLLLAIFKRWEVFIITIVAETMISSVILAAVSKGERIKMFLKCIITSPIRYLSIIMDFVVIPKFIIDLLIGNRNWRK